MVDSYQERLAEITLGLRPRNVAIAAYLTKNPDASRAIHSNLSDEPHKTNTVRHVREKYWESMIINSERGLLQTCCTIAILSGIYNHLSNSSWFLKAFSITPIHGYSWDFIYVAFSITLGFSFLFSTGLIQGYLDYQSNREYKEFYSSERKRESWEYDNYIEGEQNEMIQLYIAKGLSKQDAETVIKILSKDKKFFVDMMMKEELELLPPDEKDPLVNGAVIFLSYSFIGGIPLMAYSLCFDFYSYTSAMLVALVLAACLLLVCGILKSLISVSKWWMIGLRVVMNGLIAFSGGLIGATAFLLIIEWIFA